MVAEQGEPLAGGAVKLFAFEHTGAAQGLAQLDTDMLGLDGGFFGHLAEIFQHDHEFVTAQACHRIFFAHAGLDAPRHLAQKQVAHRVAAGIVEHLEVVEIQKQHGAVAVAAAAAGHGLAEAVEQQATVGQAGERVVIGQSMDLRRRLLVLGDLGERAHVVSDFSLGVPDAGDGQPFGIYLAILAPVPHYALPVALFIEGQPHPLVERLALTAGMQEGGVAADGLVRRVAGQLGERVIDPHDDALGVGHHHGFLPFERDGGDAQLILGPTAFADVAEHHPHLRCCGTWVPAMQARVEAASILAQHGQFHAARIAFAGDTNELLLPAVAILGGNVSGESVLKKLAAVRAEQRGAGQVDLLDQPVAREGQIADRRELEQINVLITRLFQLDLGLAERFVLHLQLDLVHLEFVQ